MSRFKQIGKISKVFFPGICIYDDCRVFRPTRSLRFIDNFKKICTVTSGICSLPLMRAMVQQIICIISRDNSHGETYGPVFKACRFIDNNFSSPVSSYDICAAAGCSPSYLRKLFKNSMGESPIHYLNRIRVDHAKKLLNIGLLTMDEIASECGFCNVYYFSRVFKEFTGISSRKY